MCKPQKCESLAVTCTPRVLHGMLASGFAIDGYFRCRVLTVKILRNHDCGEYTKTHKNRIAGAQKSTYILQND